MTLIIKQCTFAELLLEPRFQALLEEYADELAVEGLPHPKAKTEMYQKLESIGLIHPIAAFSDGILIGFINVLMSINQHYGVALAVSESFFVSKQYRKTGAGTKLLRAAESLAELLGSPGFQVSSPPDGPLAQFLPHSGYREISCAFYREFSHA